MTVEEMMAVIAHRHAPEGSWERIGIQNYLIERGLMDYVDRNNQEREKAKEI